MDNVRDLELERLVRTPGVITNLQEFNEFLKVTVGILLKNKQYTAHAHGQQDGYQYDFHFTAKSLVDTGQLAPKEDQNG